jgi:Lrp/AsnC family transcriptional regulator for asnA, asnC and gidA
MANLDDAIVALLQEDGRMSNREIGRRLGISEGAVRARLGKMTAAKQLCITALVDPRQIGQAYIAQIMVRVRPDRLHAVTAALMERPDADFLGILLGRFNLLVGIDVTSRVELMTFLTEVRAIEGVLDTSTLEIVEVVKHDSRWAKLA